MTTMKTDKTLTHDEATKSAETGVGRRSFMGWFWKLIGVLAVVELGWITRSILRSSPTSTKPEGQKLVDAGMQETFIPGTVTPVPKGQFHLVRLADGSFLALSKSCTHLGCSVPWDSEKNTFICPCHGSTFDIQGTVLTPPAMRPLDYFPVMIENGLVRVDISKTLRRDSFQIEQTSRV